MKFVLARFWSYLTNCKQLVSVSLILRVQFGCMFSVSYYASYAWFNCTCNHAPLGEWQFVSLLEVYSPPQSTQKETIPHPWAPDRPHTFFATSFLSLQKQNDTFSHFLWTFSWVYWEKDNGCHNVVKTWTINSKRKSKKKISLKSASLIEHYIYQKPCIRFHTKTYHYLKLSWRNISVLSNQKIKSVRVCIIRTFVSNFKTYL